MASSAFDILEGNEIVTWTNTIIDYSRKIEEAEKGELPARVARKAMSLLEAAGLPVLERGGSKDA